MSTTSFNLDGFSQPIPVDLTENITKEQLLAHPPFLDWVKTLKTSLASQDKTTYTLRSIKIQSVDWFGPKRIGFVKFLADVRNEQNEDDYLPGIVFLRGGSVAILMILRPIGSEHERYVVMVDQARIPVGTLSFLEIPAGMLEGNDFKGTAAAEIKEETGLEIMTTELKNMTDLALEQALDESEISSDLQRAMYPSPGGSDESIKLYLCERLVDRQEIEDLNGRLAGLRDRGEKTTVRILDYENLWKVGARDAKTLGAWALYQQLFY
jgi:ADP-sugar diphosphatase